VQQVGRTFVSRLYLNYFLGVNTNIHFDNPSTPVIVRHGMPSAHSIQEQY
jgi:hypothetical protein